MKTLRLAALGAALMTASAAYGQEPAAEVAAPAAEAETAVETVAATAPSLIEAQLAANTPLVLSVNTELNSRHLREGDTFSLTVVQDVAVDGHVVIPRGTRGVGEIVWRTGKGAFGKSGKMEVGIRYLDMNGIRIPLDGYYRQEGEGNTAATVGAVLGAGVIGGLVVTGRSAVIPSGREFTVRTIDAIPVTYSGSDGPATIAASYTPSAIQTGRRRSAEEEERRAERRSRRQRRS